MADCRGTGKLKSKGVSAGTFKTLELLTNVKNLSNILTWDSQCNKNISSFRNSPDLLGICPSNKDGLCAA